MDNKTKKFRLLEQWTNAILLIEEYEKERSKNDELARSKLAELKKVFQKNTLEFLQENPEYQANSFAIEGSLEEDEKEKEK